MSNDYCLRFHFFLLFFFLVGKKIKNTALSTLFSLPLLNDFCETFLFFRRRLCLRRRRSRRREKRERERERERACGVLVVVGGGFDVFFFCRPLRKKEREREKENEREEDFRS